MQPRYAVASFGIYGPACLHEALKKRPGSSRSTHCSAFFPFAHSIKESLGFSRWQRYLTTFLTLSDSGRVALPLHGTPGRIAFSKFCTPGLPLHIPLFLFRSWFSPCAFPILPQQDLMSHNPRRVSAHQQVRVARRIILCHILPRTFKIGCPRFGVMCVTGDDMSHAVAQRPVRRAGAMAAEPAQHAVLIQLDHIAGEKPHRQTIRVTPDSRITLRVGQHRDIPRLPHRIGGPLDSGKRHIKREFHQQIPGNLPVSGIPHLPAFRAIGHYREVQSPRAG